MAASNYRDNPVKVVIINTQYVETDAVSFKSVVQKLTGKGSEDGTISGDKRSRLTDKVPYVGSSSSAPVLSRGMSFKDLDWMLKELPELDELYGLLYADNY